MDARGSIIRKRDFSQVSPFSFRYLNRELSGYTSEAAKIIYMACVEASIVMVMCDRGMCSERVMGEVLKACRELKAAEVYLFEYGKKGRVKGTKHDVRALIKSICNRISKLARPYVHAFATSYDIIDTANAARLRDVLYDVVIPGLITVEEHLIRLTLEYADVVQVGRTHLQHGSPLTFGCPTAWFATRLGRQIVRLQRDANELVGKFSGPVGTHAPAKLAVRDPLRFEKQVLSCMGLGAGDFSTQIVIPECAVEVYHRLVMIAGVLANLADDMRHLQMTEIAEIAEPAGLLEGASSIMPHKINPITWENIVSLFKEIIGRMVTRYLDLGSNLQRDLTNSASGRFAFEMVELLFTQVKGANRILPKVIVDPERMLYNLRLTGDQIISDPLNTLLRRFGHPDAHAKVTELSRGARSKLTTLFEELMKDSELRPFVEQLSRQHVSVLRHPEKYVGIGPSKARAVVRRWARKFNLAT
ncbi:MAG: lyase family protein [Patescibacteria group bacterium]